MESTSLHPKTEWRRTRLPTHRTVTPEDGKPVYFTHVKKFDTWCFGEFPVGAFERADADGAGRFADRLPPHFPFLYMKGEIA